MLMPRPANVAAWGLLAAAGLLGACGAPAPAPEPAAAAPAPAAPTPAPPAPTAAPPPRPDPLRLAPRNPALEAWKRGAAEKIHAANRSKLFEGQPHHLLQAVIVVEATVDRSGNVIEARIMRSPKIKRLDDMALASLRSASPLPAPPASLLVRGTLAFSETWLVQNDGMFRVRTLALPQE
jgi:protein TonB